MDGRKLTSDQVDEIVAGLSLTTDQIISIEYSTDRCDSQGFYISPSRDGSVKIGAIYPIEDRSGDLYLRAELAAKFAVEDHHNNNNNNKPTEKLKFVRVVNANFEPTVIGMFYITLEAEDDEGVSSHYHVKVWEAKTTGFKIKIPLKRTPYALNPSDKVGSNICCVGIDIDNLLPWMNECYLYYKCFYLSRRELLGLEIVRDEQTGHRRGALWFKNREKVKDVLAVYEGDIMPRTTNKTYTFDFQT